MRRNPRHIDTSWIDRNGALLCLGLVLLAGVFYDDPNFSVYKRMAYSLFAYLSLFVILYFQRDKKNTLGDGVGSTVNRMLNIYIVFIFLNLVFTYYIGPVKAVTLFNHPLAFMAALTPLAIVVGARAEDRQVWVVFLLAIVFILLSFELPKLSKTPYFIGYGCSSVLIPMFAMSLKNRKHVVFAAIMLAVGIAYSLVSEYRIIALRILMFIPMLAGFWLIRRAYVFKLIMLVVTLVSVIYVVINIEAALAMFSDLAGRSNVDHTDTRTFLFEEFFTDMRPFELITGRGYLGSYFSPYFMNLMHQGDMSDFYQRFSIEVGVMELMLKGGVFYLLLSFAPILYVAFKGVLDDRYPLYVFAMSIYLFVEFIASFIENIPGFDLRTVLMYFMAGTIIKKMKTI